MSIFGKEFSADAVRNFIKEKKEAAAAELRAYEAAQKAEREKLKASFEEREVKPEALDRIATLVAKQIDRGEKQALVLQFPSDWLPDQGRAITNRDPEWHTKLEGFPKRAHDFFEKELAPRGFQLKAEILDWPGGMPGDVGFILTWKRPEEE
ncbi:hypothetical protein [Falsiroseomonas oryziterrae]|uniref:hypothetical protein n=1 Tax=Falsiroseomonas oryziterrae TaxID=2911368 RepID=UPI001F37F717|nr:hypothetical protein [Roseomonas sp. NPKOSM-4]